MFAAAYWAARTANQRREDFAIVKSLSSRIFRSVKKYYRDLLNPAPDDFGKAEVAASAHEIASKLRRCG